MEQKVEAARNLVLCQIEESLFGREVIAQAAYRFIDRCYVKLERGGAKTITVRLKGKGKLSARRLQQLGDEFGNELLHQLVREQVARRTDKLRGLLVGRALASAEAVAAGPDEAPAPAEVDAETDYLEDPLGIAIPWEEKYGDAEDKQEKK